MQIQQTPTRLPVEGAHGPNWLTRFILYPPSWVNLSLKVVAGLVLIAVIIRLYQRGFRLPVSTQIEIQRVVTHVLGVMIISLVFVTYLDLPFAWNVGGGALLGIGAAFASQGVAARIPSAWISEDERERVMIGWFVLMAAALILPELAGIQQSGLLAANTRWYLVVLSAGMALYDGALIHRARTHTLKES